MRLASSAPGRLHRLVPVSLCALGAHAVLYRSLSPASGHAYFSWYEPLVAALSLAALLVVVVLGILAVTPGRRSARRIVRLVLPEARRPEKVATRTRRLGLAGLAFLIAQESCEGVSGSTPALSAFGAGEILIVLAVLTVLALLVALVERSCANLVDLVLGRAPAGRRRRQVAPSRVLVRTRTLRRRHPLSERRGLRAPPFPA